MKKLLITACLFFGATAFSLAQQTSPVWPGCEDSEDLSACFNQKLTKHVQENYEYPMENNEYIRGKVTVSFDISEAGDVVVKSIKGPKPAVNKAARKMIEAIPEMKPGTLNGEPDSRNFTVPFNF